MAFHGAPGTGEMLTAEAVAEHLRRPLYVVSAGELGTTTQTLENQLKNVLELAVAWNAVLLIDELDRNALLGIFLHLLEYFTGILILTTNHIENFDEAFLSRFAVVLRFDELDEPSRWILWERFLLKATSSSSTSLSAFDLSHLTSFRLNGCNIKHII
ncbi:P-loop containing nucleoside triphosphate hydrolase protein [Rhodotorula toruloides]|uniref:P-loop containing nucleoside triphosphate hydrolase protein n=1 Tax=Rhodotorula toruloides TaxID=5286 RepID=A0A2T0AF29_RHOTO|nr:P-loop containing nucleoside triphosphate hydrolase protein [Rhodotorula toruloides]